MNGCIYLHLLAYHAWRWYPLRIWSTLNDSGKRKASPQEIVDIVNLFNQRTMTRDPPRKTRGELQMLAAVALEAEEVKVPTTKTPLPKPLPKRQIGR